MSLLLKSHEVVLLRLVLTMKASARYDAWVMGFVLPCLGPIGASGHVQHCEEHEDQ